MSKYHTWKKLVCAFGVSRLTMALLFLVSSVQAGDTGVAESRHATSYLSSAVNVLSLGVKNDGSEDVSAIVNAATVSNALFFPAGKYKVSNPLWLKHAICGESYTRLSKIDPTRTWFVSDLACTNGSVGVVNFSGNCIVNVERIAMMCKGFECGISITGCVQGTCTWISQVGVYNLRATGLRVKGRGSRPIYVRDFTAFGANDWPEGCTGISIVGAADCRLDGIEIMGTQIGLDIQNGHTFGTDLHLWTGCMAQRDNGKWWKGTRGIRLSEGSNFAASQVYPDTCYYAIEQHGNGGTCEIANVMYWDDFSWRGTNAKEGAFYHRPAGSTAKLVIHGGMIGVGGTDAKPGAMPHVYAPTVASQGVLVLSDFTIATNNFERLCFGRELPDYSERYTERGWCKAADIVAAASTGSCEGRLVLDDGAAWQVVCVKAKATVPAVTTLSPLNALCDVHCVKAVEADGITRLFVRHDDALPLTVRYTATYMCDRFRPLDHGMLLNHRRQSRCHEVAPLSAFTVSAR